MIKIGRWLKTIRTKDKDEYVGTIDKNSNGKTIIIINPRHANILKFLSMCQLFGWKLTKL